MDLTPPQVAAPALDRQRLIGSLSLLLQGPLFAANLDQVAEFCTEWRASFPANPIVLAISQTDLPELSRAARIGRQRTAAGSRPGALDRIRGTCTELVVAEPAAVLPGIKRGIRRNHVNLQIAAAKAGLDRITTDHVLRVRNDLLLRDAGVIDFYLERRDQPRGRAAVLDQRVLIAPYFTLNPLGLERLPFHFSDWLHLGTTRDVRRLWDVPFMTAADATYYHRHPKRPDSGTREQAFHSRLAVEQHLTVGALRRLGRDVRLDTHDDLRDAVASLRILADNFAIADFAVMPVRLDKYRHLADAREMDLLCLSDRDWWALIEAAEPEQLPAVLAAKVARADIFRAGEAAAGRGRSPLRRLLNRVRHRVGG